MNVETSARSLDRENLETALLAAGYGSFEWRRADDVIVVSPQMALITGQPQGESPAQGGQVLYADVHPDDRARVEAVVQAGLTGQGRFEVEFRTVRPDDGRSVWTRVAGVRVQDPGGGLPGVIGVVEDISERKLEESQRQTLMADSTTE